MLTLKRFKQRFGEPSEWQGDPFHIVIDWKWSFTDKDGNSISLHLQHNTQDMEEKLGNTVKLSMTNAIEAERDCFEKKIAGTQGREEKKVKDSGSETVDWERLIPH